MKTHFSHWLLVVFEGMGAILFNDVATTKLPLID